MATSWLAKDCLAAQIESPFSTPANPPPTEFPNKIKPSRASVRRRNRVAYALLSESAVENTSLKCCVMDRSCATVLQRLAGLASAPLRSGFPMPPWRRKVMDFMLALGKIGSRVDASFNEQSAPNSNAGLVFEGGVDPAAGADYCGSVPGRYHWPAFSKSLGSWRCLQTGRCPARLLEAGEVLPLSY